MTKPFMPFGKYKDHFLKDVPTQYLSWCIKNVQFKNLKLKQSIEIELRQDQDLDGGDSGYF